MGWSNTVVDEGETRKGRGDSRGVDVDTQDGAHLGRRFGRTLGTIGERVRLHAEDSLVCPFCPLFPARELRINTQRRRPINVNFKPPLRKGHSSQVKVLVQTRRVLPGCIRRCHQTTAENNQPNPN